MFPRNYYELMAEYNKRSLPRWMLAVNLFNHQTHHRGQITTLMKQLGVDPGTTDIPWLPCLQDK